MKILNTQNQDWGFWGEQARYGEEVANQKWIEASAWLQNEFGVDAAIARDWLDSKNGRHFADFLTYMPMEKVGKKHREWFIDTLAEF